MRIGSEGAKKWRGEKVGGRGGGKGSGEGRRRNEVKNKK